MIKIVKLLINIFFCKIFYNVEYINKEEEEKLKKCIICPNHSNAVEPAWIYAKTNNLAIMAKAELFKNKVMAKILTYFDVFPIHRGQKDVRSLLHSINLFKNVDNRKLLIFPEGTRIPKSEEKGIAKTGPLFVAYKAGVPILPVYISKNAKLFSKVKVTYGKPIIVTKEIIENKENLKKYASEILDEIYSLKNK
jgi:1-acyl-sn-glycerol-3-phosphate acyltransferase